MVYEAGTIECDGEHTHAWNDKGKIDDGEEIYCQECMDKLKEKISELEQDVNEKINDMDKMEDELKKEIEDAKTKIEELEEQNYVLKERIEGLQGKPGVESKVEP
jgi:polyhydroxyalkanoate synthesis regulator phasin